MSKEETINTYEAAAILGVGVTAIRNRIYRKTLAATKKKGSREWQIKLSDVQKLAARQIEGRDG